MSSKVLVGPPSKYHFDFTVGEFFFNNAERLGEKICQIDASTGQKETYSSVKLRSSRVALELQKRGITSNDVVALCTKVTLDNLIPILASFYLAAKVANLDPSLSVRQTTHLLSIVSPKIIFVEEASVILIEESLEKANLEAIIVVFEERSKYLTFDDFVKPQINEDTFRPVKVGIEDIAVIFFSSGTTGLPKAICHSHLSFLSLTHSLYQNECKYQSVLYFTSFYWISGLLWTTCAFIEGGQRVFSSRVDVDNTFKFIEKYKVTFLFMSPILTYRLTSNEQYQEYDTTSLYSIVVGGTPISSLQYQRLRAVLPHTHITFVYGQTEIGFVTNFNPKIDGFFLKTKIGSSGKPSVGITVKVVDLETNEILGPYQNGEICAKSSAVMKGYFNADSSDVFDKDGFLKTGDLGYYDNDECFYIIERTKEMFKYMSWHVVPSAIEGVLLEHPAVKEAVVFGTPKNEEIGEVPTACIILKEHFQANEKEIEQFVADRVSDFEKLRGGIIFVDALQKTPSGKMMRKEIRKTILNILHLNDVA